MLCDASSAAASDAWCGGAGGGGSGSGGGAANEAEDEGEDEDEGDGAMRPMLDRPYPPCTGLG